MSHVARAYRILELQQPDRNSWIRRRRLERGEEVTIHDEWTKSKCVEVDKRRSLGPDSISLELYVCVARNSPDSEEY